MHTSLPVSVFIHTSNINNAFSSNPQVFVELNSKRDKTLLTLFCHNNKLNFDRLTDVSSQ